MPGDDKAEPDNKEKDRHVEQLKRLLPHTSAYVSIRQHTSAYVGIRQYGGVEELVRLLEI
jgi:hypothetical protein